MQLTLSIGLRDDASFENFFPGENAVALEHLTHLLTAKSEGSVYLWGASACGKTHLLQALCHLAYSQQKNAVYLPLQGYREFDISMLEGLESCPLVCIDDIDAVAGHKLWEQEIFHLYNRMLETGAQLVVSATHPIQDIPIVLPDLKSRLAWGPVFHIKELTEEEKIQALQRRAMRRGFDLPENVLQFLFRRYSRDMNSLLDLLNELDKASLVAKRRLTVPFVKEWLENTKLTGMNN